MEQKVEKIYSKSKHKNDLKFLKKAFAIAKKSQDPNTQVGAVIVNKQNEIVSIGVNGFFNVLKKSDQKWTSAPDADWIDTKYPYVIHAEMNAVANAIKKNKSLVGCKIYVTLCPCNECLKNLIHFGIKQVIYGGITERHANLPVFKASFKIAKSNGLVFKQLSID